MTTKRDVLEIGTTKQLLFDDALTEAKEGFTTTMNPAVRTDEPVLLPEKPWEHYGLSFGLTVMQDEGVYKMWYMGNGEDRTARLCYATSQDGIHWVRPNLGIIDYKGSKENNIVFEGNCGTVFKDPTAPPEKRFKYIYMHGKYQYESISPGGARFRYAPTPPPYSWRWQGISGAYSPDGIHWIPTEKEYIIPWYTDTVNVAFWDERIKKYIAFVRWNEHFELKNGALRGSFNYRAIGRAESDDFENFPVPEKVIDADFGKPEDKDLMGGGLYNNPVVKYPFAADAYFVFISAYYHTSDALDVQLAASRDGVHFTRWRQPFVRLGLADAFDSMTLYMGVGMLPVGNELWMYYEGSTVCHDTGNEEEYRPKIGRVRIRLDGFVSQDAPGSGGSLTTVPLKFGGDRILVNMDGSAGGWLKVEVLDESMRPVEGFSEEECDQLFGNDVRKLVTWKGKSEISALRGKTVHLRFIGKSVKLYAFQFSPSSSWIL